MEQSEDKIWYYATTDGRKFGPYTDDELVKLIHNGILSGDDMIWMVDLENWVTISSSIYSIYLPEAEETSSQ
jgi:hypothetical protein